MAITNGSEKQIKWAQDLQARLIASIEAIRPQVPAAHHSILDGAIAWYSAIVDAKFFIDLRDYLLSDATTACQAVMTLDPQSGQVPFAKRCKMYRLSIPAFPTPVTA